MVGGLSINLKEIAMSITSVSSGSLVTTQSTGGDQKPPIQQSTTTEAVQTEETDGVIVTLGQAEEESPVYTRSTGGDQKPPIKPE